MRTGDWGRVLAMLPRAVRRRSTGRIPIVVAAPPSGDMRGRSSGRVHLTGRAGVSSGPPYRQRVTSEDMRGRPAWLDSPGAVAVLTAAAAMWVYLTVAALMEDAYLLAVLDGLFLIASVWTLTRTSRRRRHRTIRRSGSGRGPGTDRGL